MSLDQAKNFAKATVSTGYDAAATSIVLNTGDGAKLPTAPFNVVWWNATDYPDPSDDPNVEIVRVTGKSSDTLTVTRAQESTSASTKNTAGKTYKMIAGLTAKTINTDIPALIPTSDWQQLGETTLGANGQTLTVGSLPTRKDLMVVLQLKSNGWTGGQYGFQFNGDTGSNYWTENFGVLPGNTTFSNNQGAGAADTIIYTEGFDIAAGNYITIVAFITNRADWQKLLTGHMVWTASSGTPRLGNYILGGMWTNTADQINSVTFRVGNATGLATGSRMTVYGKKD
jgi:hypothetical protein